MFASRALQVGLRLKSLATGPGGPSLVPRAHTALAVGLRARGMAMWSTESEKQHVLPKAEEIINESLIFELLESTKELAKDRNHVKTILQSARERALLKTHTLPCKTGDEFAGEFVQGLTLEECATLLNVDSKDEDIMKDLYQTALDIKQTIYGNRIVLFAPLYLSNYCVNSCTYCGFRCENQTIERSLLEDEEIVQEVEALEKQGHRRLLVLTGEHPRFSFDRFLDSLRLISSVKTDPCGNIRRINVEIPMLSISDMRRLKATDVVGTYTLFQETYHRETFDRVHPRGSKGRYNTRILTMDRAQIGGIDDVGIGALFGLYDYKFEVMGLLSHAQHLDRTYGAGPHTVSIPRMRPADNAPDSINVPYAVNDDDFRKLVAILRCSVPYTGMILSTREGEQMRQELLHLGVSQMSAGSRTEVGSYSKEEEDAQKKAAEEGKSHAAGQFTLLDNRPLESVVSQLMKDGYVPSFCTACYRVGRTGEHFMKIAKRGDIHNFCHPNSLLTLSEYVQDYASDKVKEQAEAVIERERMTIESDRARSALDRKLKRIRLGERDLYF